MSKIKQIKKWEWPKRYQIECSLNRNIIATITNQQQHSRSNLHHITNVIDWNMKANVNNNNKNVVSHKGLQGYNNYTTIKHIIVKINSQLLSQSIDIHKEPSNS